MTLWVQANPKDALPPRHTNPQYAVTSDATVASCSYAHSGNIHKIRRPQINVWFEHAQWLAATLGVGLLGNLQQLPQASALRPVHVPRV